MTGTPFFRTAFATLLTAALGLCVPAGAQQKASSGTPYSPYVDRTYPTNVYWGDTHLHTRLSQDAFTFGVTLGPEDAYRFARGEEVTATHGERTKLARPMDFLVVTDHAEGLGAMQALMDGNEKLVADARLARWREKLIGGGRTARQEVFQDGLSNGWPALLNDDGLRGTAWSYLARTADKYNDPGTFTALIGYEWTSMPGGSNLHRVVIFRDDASKATQVLPFSYNESEKPEDLWRYLEAYEARTGGSVMAIPHNGNLSNGLMFPLVDANGQPLSDDYLQKRSKWEPVAEVTQIKGDGETHPFLSPDDGFAAYETWDFGNFRGVSKTNEMLRHEYARAALRLGLALEKERGTNPYKFGMIGSTDSHTALATAEESNFFGKHSAGMEPQPNRWKDKIGGEGETIIPGLIQAASGYAAVWAKENTRAAIWDALKRKEVYATTGPRMTVRLFGGWGFTGADANQPDLAAIGYGKGVPMGGDLGKAGGGAPSFLVAALKDPIGANLDRVQIVKGWVDDAGKTHERVHDVAWSNAQTRAIGADGKLAPVGSTVDVANATWTNTIGASELRVVWTDPDFDAAQHAFYYVRVLQIPTPRWTAYDRKAFGGEMPENVAMAHQERAYTSPIWYTPRINQEGSP